MPESDKKRYFNGLAADWDNLPRMDGSDEKVRRYVAQSAAGAPSRILDVGCGTGILLAALLERLPEVECVVEVDFAIEMLRQNAYNLSDRRVSRVCADALRLPAASGSFDLVLCFGILPHLSDGAAALAEFLRVLQPGGALTVGHLAGSKELNAFHGSLDGPVSKDVLLPSDELARALGKAGAVRIHAEEDPGWYFVRAEKPAA
ncbi:MAG: class I SAM-dependent methyltransferase [Bryobacterales bacterium]|nr:class I SAM-dependent methyltransferase [Bryobacterales bacterium]